MTPTSHNNILCDFAHWKAIADHNASQYNKPFNVVRNNRGEYLVFPASVECKGLSEIVYTAGGENDAKASDTVLD